MNGTTKPTMTATQKRTSSQREENGGVIATFINQFPPIDWICQVGKHFLDGSLDLAADFELQHRHRTSLPLVLLTSVCQGPQGMVGRIARRRIGRSPYSRRFCSTANRVAPARVETPILS